MSGRCERSVGAWSEGGGCDEEAAEDAPSDMATGEGVRWCKVTRGIPVVDCRPGCHASHVRPFALGPIVACFDLAVIESHEEMCK